MNHEAVWLTAALRHYRAMLGRAESPQSAVARAGIVREAEERLARITSPGSSRDGPDEPPGGLPAPGPRDGP